MRSYGIDVFRIMCCIGVLCYHIMDDILWSLHAKIIYFGASFCVPGFFLLSGYLLRSKKDISVAYIENKVVNTMLKLFGWIIFWTVIHYLRTGEMYDVWEHFTAGALSRGVLPVAWFLFTYCFLMVIGYLLYRLCKKYFIYFCGAVILWMTALAGGGG